MKVVKIELIKNKIIWIMGIIIAVSIGILELLLYNFCNDNIMCVALLFIPLLPGAISNFEGYTSIFVSLVFWFIIGALIGILISKLKK